MVNKIQGDVIRGVNGIPGCEYLIVKFKDYFKITSVAVLYCHNDTGLFGEWKLNAPDAHSLLSSINDYLTYEVADLDNPGKTRKLDTAEKFIELFTKGSITGMNKSKGRPITISLASVPR